VLQLDGLRALLGALRSCRIAGVASSYTYALIRMSSTVAATASSSLSLVARACLPADPALEIVKCKCHPRRPCNPLSAQYPPNTPPMTTASKCRVPFAVASSQVLHTNQGDIAESRSGRSSRFIPRLPATHAEVPRVPRALHRPQHSCRPAHVSQCAAAGERLDRVRLAGRCGSCHQAG
jgi:hypothetical protein